MSVCLVVETSSLADALLCTCNELLGNLKAVRGIRGLRQDGLRDLCIIQGVWNV